ncbi:ABC-1 domain protein [Planctopirus limnophila DSM 3776]|uniref:ABC-1 domain protein n=1 Tax=Planctopirus limnophila (strain ATCC 43296 / DSM 3776 / IFAM 1008 / Mu 290) TaxID=521674 RepID=D5STW0_PLAL2|nr:ABC-1 domain protein [Planctopirus limnophila DSM 3776]
MGESAVAPNAGEVWCGKLVMVWLWVGWPDKLPGGLYAAEEVWALESSPFRLLRNLSRTREIATVLLNHGFGDLVDRIGLREVWYQSIRRVFFWRRHKPLQKCTTVERVRLSLESLGPTFIKFGQVMSTRPDIVPPAMITELKKLQEHVPPFGSEAAIREVESELGKPVHELYREFDMEPLAAGSLAQVHRAVAFDGSQLVVKIRRPNVVRDIERDLSLLEQMAVLAEAHVPETRVFDPTGLVKHFARSIRREVNFAREGRTMDEFRRLFADDPSLYVPKVWMDLTTEAVLTMEYIDGIKVDDRDALLSAGCDPCAVAASGAKLYMKQAFELGVFHGDPHPGNVRVKPCGTIVLLDFGMIGILDADIREQLVDLFVAISRQDVPLAVRAVLKFGESSTAVDEALLHVDMRDFLGNYYGVPLDKLNVGTLLGDFMSLLTTHQIRCPGSLMLLIRAIVTLEGIGRRLDPDFNLAPVLQPYIENVVRARFSPQRLRAEFRAEATKLWNVAHELPAHINKAVAKLSQDDLRVHLEHQGLGQLILELERASNRLVVGFVVSALIVASALIIRQGMDSLWFSVPIYFTSSVLALWLIYGIFRSGRL